MSRERTVQRDAQLSTAIRIVCFGTAVGALAAAVLLLLLSYAFVVMKKIPQGAVMPLGVVLGAVGAFLGGYVSGRISKQKGLLFGVITGLVLYALLFLFGLILIKEPISTLSFVKMGAMLFFGALGGVLGVNKKTKIR